MRIEWFGQSSFAIAAAEGRVFIDPFGEMPGLAERGMHFDYPPIEADADLLLVTHEHRDHNAVEVIGGEPAVIRSTAGTHESPFGTVVGVASEHDAVAGTQRGPNTIYVLELEGVRIAHFGDFGQPGLRPEQLAALGSVDLLIVPVGGGPTIGAVEAREIAEQLSARWIVPMHYRTPRISFLDDAEDFLGRFDRVLRLETSAFDTGELHDGDGPLAIVPAAP